MSGGADSLALLVLAVATGAPVTAHHVDHGLRPGSAAEADVVATVAARLGAGFVSLRVELAEGPNLEARARAARRGALPVGAATGHTADDQAETVLLNLLRGAGRTGLSGMRPGPRHPILGLRRSETGQLCAEAGLSPVKDPSNESGFIRRNRVRHELLPLMDEIAQRDVVAVVALQAAHLREEDQLLDALAADLDPTDTRGLRAAEPALARRALRRWLTDADGYPPSSEALERVMAVARHEALATEIEGGRRISRRAGRLERSAPADTLDQP